MCTLGVHDVHTGFREQKGVSVIHRRMEAIAKIGTVNVARSQRARWQSGHLALEWRTRFPDLFDDDDLRIATSQPRSHFYEWLGAIVLHHATGYLSLVEKYEFAAHPRKQEIVAQLLPHPVREALRDRNEGRAQAPDLLMYAADHSDWFFCEVKGRVTACGTSRFVSSSGLQT
jgi:hypothetical protein